MKYQTENFYGDISVFVNVSLISECVESLISECVVSWISSLKRAICVISLCTKYVIPFK